MPFEVHELFDLSKTTLSFAPFLTDTLDMCACVHRGKERFRFVGGETLLCLLAHFSPVPAGMRR